MKQTLLNEFQRLKTLDNYSTIMKKVKIPISKDLEKFIYYFNVWLETEQNALNHTEIHKRNKSFHLDHIIPISLGYKYNINPNIIGSLNNIRFISLKDNFKKNSLITDDVLNKLIEFNIDINSLSPIKRDKIILKDKPIPIDTEPILKVIDFQPLIKHKDRLSIYPRGNKR